MAELKPVYLIHGDDHGAVAERRAGLRALAEGEGGGAGNVELLEGEAGTPGAIAQALATMTLATGGAGGAQSGGLGRVILVEGVERWRQADVERHLAPAIEEMPPHTTLALFAREEARAKAPVAVHEAVKRAGGQVVAQMTVKSWELPKWVREQGARMSLSLDGAAAEALIAQVGARQQRLLRELEKLALEGEIEEPSAGRRVEVEDVERRAARSAELQAWGLADALVAADGRGATAAYLRLRQQGERLSGLTDLMSQRLRDALAIALRLRAGESHAQVRRGLRMPARAAERLLADVARTDPDRLRQALCSLADLEIDSRGGAVLAAGRSPLAGLEEDTLVLRAIETITA
jgi:DNA polymerase-3 subunit delta